MGDSIVSRERVSALLATLSLTEEHLASAWQLIPDRAIGILVYGSRARDDFIPTSDLDLLTLLTSPAGSRIAKPATMSFYTPAQLASASGTLFSMHLSRDGVIVHDTNETLSEILKSMVAPDPAILLSRVRHYSAILDASEPDLLQYLPGMARIARYLLRTAIYALALKQGSPCFSVRQLADRFSEPDLATVLSSDPAIHGPVSRTQFATLVGRLVQVIGSTEVNPHGSLHAMIVAEWYSDRERATLATLATASPDHDFDYAELPKVLL